MMLPSFPVTHADLDDLHRRLESTRPATAADAGAQLPPWQRGTDPLVLQRLLARWRSEYHWREREARILELPWTRAAELNVVHRPANTVQAPVVVLLHGWPDSVLRFERLLPLLDGLEVVIPALPGFPFAAESPMARMTTSAMAELVADALHDLGRDRFVLSGGDVGGEIAEHLAVAHPDRVAALHLTNISPLHAVFADRSNLTQEELAYLESVGRWSRTEGGYIAEQSSKPATLATALADSPAGLASWILEKLHGWSETMPGDDDALTWISAYWFSNAIGSSFATYAQFTPPPPYVPTPTVFSAFGHDTKPAPRQFVERFVGVREWIEHEHGGHFAAWEQPELYAADLRRAVGV